VHGFSAIKGHYLGEILSRSSRGSSALSILTAYPMILLRDFQPITFPAVLGVVILLRQRAWRQCPESGLLLVWLLLPLVLYGLSSARSPRYVFPLLPGMALCAGAWLTRTLPRAALWMRQAVVPGLVLVTTLLFWLHPRTLTRDSNRMLKQNGSTFGEVLPAGVSVPYWGEQYWRIANPLLYYGERHLAEAAVSVGDALARAHDGPSGTLICDRAHLARLAAADPELEILLEHSGWAWVRVGQDQKAERGL
jgi:hypothetical protein